MGVAGYFPGGLPDLQRELRDAVADVTRKRDVAIEPLGLAEVLVRQGERYDFVEDCDAVRSHCRVDRLG